MVIAGQGGTPSIGSVDNPGSAERPAAGSGGNDSGMADAGPGPDASDDPFGGLFGPLPTGCDGLLCLEDGDCATFYPDETASCKFTRCVDFVCE
jgi:hypothetical protein